jgi:prolyl oligopeptidase
VNRCVLVVVSCACSKSPAAPVERPPEDTPPPARSVEVIEDRFGQRVTDPYRWMEGDRNPERDAWLDAQGAYSAKKLAALAHHDEMFRRITELQMSASDVRPPQLAGGRAFYKRSAAHEFQSKLVVRDRRGERVLVDLGWFHTIVNFAASRDGNKVAINVGRDDSEVTSIDVVDVETGALTSDAVDRVWSEFPATWLPDGKAFLYTQMASPAPGVDPMLDMRVRLHRPGMPADRDPVVWRRGGAFAYEAQEFPSIATATGAPWLLAWLTGARQDGRLAVAALAELDHSGAAATPWRIVAGYDDQVKDADALDDRLYMLSSNHAPNRRVVSVPLAHPDLAAARIEVPEDRDRVVRSFALARDALYVEDLVAGRGRIRRMPWSTRKIEEVALPFDGTVEGLAAEAARDGVTIQLVGWTHPPEQFSYDVAAHAWRSTGAAAHSDADFTHVIADETEATSFDGERIPLTILRTTTTKPDSSRPTILDGYAAYGAIERPSFRPMNLAWLERGGVLAFCHGRGGGERGDRWYQAGVREHKLTGVRDFIACAEALIARKLTAPEHLAAFGESAGGILVGRAVVERPHLFAAVALRAGMMNPLRILHALNGANQVAELGSPETPAGFRQILEIDPYHQLDASQSYPAMLFAIGLTDSRVAPWMTAKMAARMQAMTPRRPVWIRVDRDAGHGVTATPDQIQAERADVWAFLLSQLER